MRNDSGNILFLILIAVALFAALSYAVTQSSRGGAGNTVKETSTINSSVLSQSTSSIRASLQRMTTDNNTLLDIQFNGSADFNDLTSNALGVFHPSGGGVIYAMAPTGVINAASSNPTGQWVYTLNFEVANVGTSVAGSLDGNDLLAMLPGVTMDVCKQADNRLGISTQPFPTINNAAYSSDLITNLQNYYMDNDYTMPGAELVIGNNAGDSTLSGKAEGCFFEASTQQYVYYSVLSER